MRAPARARYCSDLEPHDTVARACAYRSRKPNVNSSTIEGVAGPEAANNAAVGGAMVPTLALGIPGSTTTAIILAGLIVQGVRPGPHLFTEQPLLLYAVFSSMLAANLLYLVLGLGFAKVFARISMVPAPFLWPAVFVLSVIGAYAPNQALAEVWVAIAFGFIGFAMRRYGFSPAPLVIGLVLGNMTEETLKQSLLIFDQSWLGFAGRPIALALLLTTAVLLVGPHLWHALGRRGRPAGQHGEAVRRQKPEQLIKRCPSKKTAHRGSRIP
jgi:putative tricarboxylic transport membrane protein